MNFILATSNENKRSEYEFLLKQFWEDCTVVMMPPDSDERFDHPCKIAVHKAKSVYNMLDESEKGPDTVVIGEDSFLELSFARDACSYKTTAHLFRNPEKGIKTIMSLLSHQREMDGDVLPKDLWRRCVFGTALSWIPTEFGRAEVAMSHKMSMIHETPRGDGWGFDNYVSANSHDFKDDGPRWGELTKAHRVSIGPRRELVQHLAEALAA